MSSFTEGGDLQEPVSVTLKNFLKANWPSTSMLQTSQIKFGNKWFDDFGSYQIHLEEPNQQEHSLTLGWRVKSIARQIDIHIFVRKNQLTQPIELDDMKRTVTSIIMLNRLNLPISQPYSNFMRVVRERDIVDTKPLETLWHSVITIEVLYWMAKAN